MESPGTLLALLAAIFGTATAAAFGELTCELFPLTAFVIRTLANTASGLVLTTEVPHHHASPV